MNYHNLNDYELVKRFQEGDHNSFKELITRYKSKIFTYILITVRDRELAEDIFQETFFKVINSLKKGNYTHQGRFVSWVVRIAHNLIIDHYRKSNNVKTYNHEDKELDIFHNRENSSDNIEKQLINNQIVKDVRKIINLLPHEQKEVILLRHFVGLSFKEIAEETGVSINTALGRMRYALINLRKIIKEKNLQFEMI
ncbi:MAG: sigma-70 family RNA polymerase sigma factor [Marinilabiliales bacterium]